jgi:predicted component of type VI protein secretion system
MSSAPLLDIESLAAPISDDRPCGTYKEHDETDPLFIKFADLELAFDTARNIERSRTKLDTYRPEDRRHFVKEAEGRPEDPNADPRWQHISDECAQILSGYSKDMRVMAWLIEARLRAAGYVGLREALRGCAELMERYGEKLYPLGDTPEDTLYCYLPIDRLNQSTSLMQAIQRVSFFPDGPYHYAAYVAAKVFQGLPSDEQAELQDIGVPLLGDFDAAVNECSVDQLNSYLAQIEAAIEAAEVVDRQLRGASEALRAAEAKLVGFEHGL